MSTLQAHDGSSMFQFVSDLTGISLDKVNFVISQIVALVVAAVFRKVLHPRNVGVFIRHLVSFTVGLLLAIFCFGWKCIHLITLPVICFLILLSKKPHSAQKWIFIVSMVYLSYIHLQRQIYDYASYTLDITGPLMVIVQKLTSISYFLEDDTAIKSEKVNNQKLNPVPSFFEFFGYIFQFQTLLAGPLVFYNDYLNFIKGSPDLNKYSPRTSVTRKVTTSLICALLFLKLTSTFPEEYLKNEHFLQNTTIYYKLFYLMMITFLVRFKYYHAWIFADAICNNSGLGFSGLDSKTGEPKWDLVTNVDILHFEFGLSMRDSIEAWNIGTNKWLRLMVYDRVKKYPLILTYTLSACWHGFYPGYYLTFLNGAFFTFVARKVRRSLRATFQQTVFTKYFYDAVTCLATRFTLAYIIFPFIVLELMPSWRLYKSMFFCLHILAMALLIILPNNVQQSRSPTTDIK